MKIGFSFFQRVILSLLVILSMVTTSTAFAVPQGFADLTAPLLSAVVNVSTVQKPSKSGGGQKMLPFPEGSPFEEFNQFFERFGQPNGGYSEEEEDDRKSVSLGSGFVIDASGYIVTNHHVVAEADEINVKFSDGKQLKAKLVGSDMKTDLALLKIETDKPLQFVKFGDSDQSRVGDWIIAIGNPFGLGGTVTAGIISAHARDINTEGGIVDNYIQTDAAINRGNSGGPMFNMQGEVIGINTAIYSPSGVNIGIGFATPSTTAKLVIEQLKKTGKVIRGLLGVKIQSVTEDIAESLGIASDQGALVVEVSKDSAAEKAGVKVGDIIISFNNQAVTSTKKLPRIVSESPIGKEVDLVIMRDGSKKTFKVSLNESKEEPSNEEAAEQDMSAQYGAKDVLGASFAVLNDDLKKKFGIAKEVDGLVVLKINRKTQWSSRGFKVGDVVVSANQVKLSSVEKFSDVVANAKKNGKKSVLLFINRQDQALFIPFPISEK
jgi:serine protease Do